jgi:hypothetical protein
MSAQPAQSTSGLRMSVAGIEDAEKALADLHGPERGGDNTLRRLNSAAFVGERYGAALVADWALMHSALSRLMEFGEALMRSEDMEERGIGTCICEGARMVRDA